MSRRPVAESRTAYLHTNRITTRWMDNDVYGHINNVVCRRRCSMRWRRCACLPAEPIENTGVGGPAAVGEFASVQ